MNTDTRISPDMLKEYSRAYSSNGQINAMANALSKNDINAVTFDNRTLSRLQPKFSLEIETMKATNQKSSGRCWLFAGLNVLREIVSKKVNLEYFEFSQNYAAFWDKFEKINYFLESIVATAGEDVDSRLVNWILQTGVQDGGQWDMFVSLVEKYGVVPKEAMPETFQSSNTGTMNRIMNTKLRKAASILRGMFEKGASHTELERTKMVLLSEFYSFLCACFGEPPAEFEWEVRDKDKKFVRFESLTPAKFRDQYLGFLFNEYVSIINSPTRDKPFGKTFTVRFLGNVVGGRDILYLNTDIVTLKNLTLSQLKDGEVVWFGSDVGKYGDRDAGIWDSRSLDYNKAFGMDFSNSKEERLDYRDSAMNHAMVITGVNLHGEKPDRWKIENSWGEEKGEKGYYMMSDDWFDEYVYQVVINKKHLPKALLDALKAKPIELQPWDPMGSLAITL